MAKCNLYKWGGTWDVLDEMLEEQKRGLDCSESSKRNDQNRDWELETSMQRENKPTHHDLD